MNIKTLFPLLCLSGFTAQAAVVTVEMDLTTTTEGSTSAGDFLDTGEPSVSYTVEGVTFTITAGTNFGDGTAVFNATNNNAGVNTDGGGSSIGDDAAQIDPGETMTIVISYGPTVTDVVFTEIDFGGVGDSTDSATVEYPDGAGGSAVVTLTDGSTDFSSSDAWSPSGGIAFDDGESITFSNTSEEGAYRLQTITFDVTSVPEPSGALLALLGGACFLRRRR